jgi:integrase
MASIEKRPNGKWRARFRDASRREHARHFARKVDAQRWLDEQTAALVTGQFVDPRAGRVTFRDYAEQWRARKQRMGKHRPSTASRVRQMLSRYAYPVIGERPISTVQPLDVLEVMARSSESLSPSTLAVLHAVLASVFRSAVKERIIPSSPCQDTAAELPEPPQRHIEPLSAEQVSDLADGMPTSLRAAVLVAAGTGLRPGELFGLTVNRVDFLRRRLTVDQQLQTPDERGTVPTLVPVKTAESVRTIPLPRYVADELAAHLARFPVNADGLVFHRDDGAPYRRGQITTVMQRARKAAGLPASITWHDLRHHTASVLIANGESVKVVQRWLGHKSAAITLDVYSHLFDGSMESAADALDGARVARSADYLRTVEGPGE